MLSVPRSLGANSTYEISVNSHVLRWRRGRRHRRRRRGRGIARRLLVNGRRLALCSPLWSSWRRCAFIFFSRSLHAPPGLRGCDVVDGLRCGCFPGVTCVLRQQWACVSAHPSSLAELARDAGRSNAGYLAYCGGEPCADNDERHKPGPGSIPIPKYQPHPLLSDAGLCVLPHVCARACV